MPEGLTPCVCVYVQVEAVVVYGNAQDETNRFNARSESNNSKSKSFALDEDVFVSMLHRRARLLNPAFQAKVLAVLLERQSPQEAPGEEFFRFGTVSDVECQTATLGQESHSHSAGLTLPLETPVVESLDVVHLPSLRKGGSNLTPASLESLCIGEHLNLIPISKATTANNQTSVVSAQFELDQSMFLARSELNSLPVPCALSELALEPTQILRTPSKYFLVEDFLEPLQVQGASSPVGSVGPAFTATSSRYMELVCWFRTGLSPILVNHAPIKTKQRMGEKLAEYAADGAHWPRSACILDPVRAAVVCKGPSEMLEVIEWFTENQTKTGLQVCRVKNKFSFSRQEVMHPLQKLFLSQKLSHTLSIYRAETLSHALSLYLTYACTLALSSSLTFHCGAQYHRLSETHTIFSLSLSLSHPHSLFFSPLFLSPCSPSLCLSSCSLVPPDLPYPQRGR